MSVTMNNLSWTPWYKVVSIQPDLRSGELSLATFSADLYDIAMQRGVRRAYEDSLVAIWPRWASQCQSRISRYGEQLWRELANLNFKNAPLDRDQREFFRKALG